MTSKYSYFSASRTDKTRWMEAFKPPAAEQEGETVYASWGKDSSIDFSRGCRDLVPYPKCRACKWSLYSVEPIRSWTNNFKRWNSEKIVSQVTTDFCFCTRFVRKYKQKTTQNNSLLLIGWSALYERLPSKHSSKVQLSSWVSTVIIVCFGFYPLWSV